jgi:two-component sensor histidine kinase
LGLYQKTKYRELQGLYDLIAYVSSLLGDYESGVKYGLAALRTAEAVHDTTLQLCTIYNRLGLTYSRLTQYPQSQLYYEKAVKIALKFKDTATITQVMLNNADALRRIHRLKEALSMLKDCMVRYLKNDKEFELLALTTMVTIYLDMKDVNLAGITCNKMLSELAKSPAADKNIEMAVRLSAVKYFTEVGQFKKAREHLSIYTERNSRLHIAIGILTSYKYKYIIDSTQHRYLDALNDYRQYSILKDSVFNLKKSKQIEELRISYESDKKEKNIQLLKKDSVFEREKTANANNIRNLTLAGSALLIILLGVIYANYRAKQRTNIALNALVSEKDELIKEKEWLIKEVHHRVKNNLQIVMGLLQRQSAYIDNETALQAIQNSESRMHSIALIHQKLYQSENLDLINMPEYIAELVTYLKESSDTGSRISFEKSIADIYLAVSQAVPLGLIMNEAITNAIKYAYTTDEFGTIRIVLKQLNQEKVVLTIEDDGRGLQSGFDISKVNSLGMSLMKGLSKQINGTFELNNSNGVQIQVTFKIECFTHPPHELTNT